MNYNKTFKSYKKLIKKYNFNKNNNYLEELRFESTHNWKSKHKMSDIKKWYFSIIKKSKLNVKQIDLSKCNNWISTKKNIYHNSRKFFKVEALRITNPYRREVGNKGWDQPILTEPNFDGGILGLLRKRINGVPHYLVNIKFEPGNYRLFQISPTLQATFSNIEKAHKGKEPRFLKYFLKPKKNKCEIIFKHWFSEEGGRLRNKRNLGIMINYKSNKNIIITNDFSWITMWQIKNLIRQNAYINPHLRGLVSFF